MHLITQRLPVFWKQREMRFYPVGAPSLAAPPAQARAFFAAPTNSTTQPHPSLPLVTPCRAGALRCPPLCSACRTRCWTPRCGRSSRTGPWASTTPGASSSSGSSCSSPAPGQCASRKCPHPSTAKTASRVALLCISSPLRLLAGTALTSPVPLCTRPALLQGHLSVPGHCLRVPHRHRLLGRGFFLPARLHGHRRVREGGGGACGDQQAERQACSVCPPPRSHTFGSLICPSYCLPAVPPAPALP